MKIPASPFTERLRYPIAYRVDPASVLSSTVANNGDIARFTLRLKHPMVMRLELR